MMLARRAALLIAIGLLPLPAFGRGGGGGGGGGGSGGGGGQGGGGGGRGGQGGAGGQGGRGQGGGGQGGGNSGRANNGGQGRGNGGGRQAGAGNPGRGGPRPRMGNPEFGAVQTWLGSNPGFIAQPLPPGMRNRFAQGKPLPPGIERRAVPPDLLSGLPVYPGYEYAMVGTSLALLAVGTGTVSAILSNAFGR